MLTTIAYFIIATMTIAADDKSPTGQASAEQAKPIPKAEFTNAGHTVDDVKDVQQFVKNKQAILLDVREQKEWNAGRLKLAKFMPLSVLREGEIPEKLLKKLPKDKPIYLHCLSGGRVLMAAEILKPKGYDIRPLRSGYEKLLKAGFDKAKPKEIEQMDSKDNEAAKK